MEIQPPHSIREAQTLAKVLGEKIPPGLLRSEKDLCAVAKKWCERHRVWHGTGHLLAMLDEIEISATGEERDILLLAAVYHDAIYDPREGDNEENSALLLAEHATDPASPIVSRAAEIIRASRWDAAPETALTQRFFELDTKQLADGSSLSRRMDYERAVFREYQFAPWETYLVKRREFLKSWAKRFPQHSRGVRECLEVLDALRPRVALYPGSFNPFHLGHLSILRQAEMAFDKVIIGVGANRQKPGATNALPERQGEIATRLRFHEVAAIPGLVTRFVEQLGFPVTVVRGVRDGTDLEAELRYARFLNELRANTNIVWISCEPHLQHLSSSSIRELEAIEPGAGRRYMPDVREIYDLA